MDGRLELRPGQSVDINATQGWSGHFWGRCSCSFDNSGQGSCVPPATLAEFTLDSPVDFYDVSLVDRYNMLESIFPSGRSGECKAVTCVSDLNQRCPKDLQVLRNGTVVLVTVHACHSTSLSTAALAPTVLLRPPSQQSILKCSRLLVLHLIARHMMPNKHFHMQRS